MSKKTRILFLLTNGFTNDSRVLKEGTSLVNANYDVTLACMLLAKLPQKEVVNGIKVNRYGFYINTNKPKKNKILGNSLWILSALKLYNYFKFIFQTYIKHNKNTDIVHCHDLNTLPIGVLFKIFSWGRIKIVYDAHEHETEVGFSVIGLKKILYQITERICIKFANKVITVSDSIADEYSKLYKIEKPTVLFNTPEFKEPKELDIFRNELGISKDQIIFIYQGGLMRHRGIEIMLGAFEKLQGHSKVVVFLGYGELDNIIKSKAKKNSNIYYYPAVKPSELLDYTASADIGISFIENSCLSYYYCLPNKLFEYTMAKIPSIVSNLFEQSKFIKNNKNGIVVDKITTNSLKEAIEKITIDDINQMKQATDNARKKYNWQNEEKKLIALYDSL